MCVSGTLKQYATSNRFSNEYPYSSTESNCTTLWISNIINGTTIMAVNAPYNAPSMVVFLSCNFQFYFSLFNYFSLFDKILESYAHL